MDYYQVCFGGLVVLCFTLLISQPTRRQKLEQEASPTHDDEHPEASWYMSYALAVAASWLQGPYLLSLYGDDYGLAPSTIFNLFMTEFVTTAISGYFIGSLSDRYGRKLCCMAYCVLFALSCFFTIIPIMPLLFLGRVLGGINANILGAAFDGWMVTNFHEGKLAEKGCDLTRTYAATSVVNSVAAILSGFLGDSLIWATGTNKSPFYMSTVLTWLAFQTIWSRWNENIGAKAPSMKTRSASLRPIWSTLKDPSILAVTFASAMFDGSMSILALCSMPNLSSLHKSADTLPFGIIFSSFMAASMAGALAFNIVMNKWAVKYSHLMVGVLLAAVSCFGKLSGARTEHDAFWLICLVWVCTGIFGPCVGCLKGDLIDDDARSTIYSILRIPSNMLAIISLMLAKGNNNAESVFTLCSFMLTTSLAVVSAAASRGMP